jgi:hypothetical protein
MFSVVNKKVTCLLMCRLKINHETDVLLPYWAFILGLLAWMRTRTFENFIYLIFSLICLLSNKFLYTSLPYF